MSSSFPKILETGINVFISNSQIITIKTYYEKSTNQIINLNLESSFFKSFPLKECMQKKFAKCKHSGSVLEGLGSRCLSPQNPRYLRNPQISQIPVEIWWWYIWRFCKFPKWLDTWEIQSKYLGIYPNI